MFRDNYQSFTHIQDDDDVIINVIPQSNNNVRLWEHFINDLDVFFSKIYKYHRYGGFNALLAKYIAQLIQFFFVVCLTIILTSTINYEILFNTATNERTINDIFKSSNDIILSPWEWVFLFFSLISFIFKILKFCRKLQVYFAIKQFYADALRIKDCTLYTWQEVQSRLIEAKRVCLFQGTNITELDIHNRILRRKNYMIALVNKQVLPIYYQFPIFGEGIYMPKGLIYCFQLLFFKAPIISIFEKSWKLRDEYKQFNKREECAQKFRKNCLILAILMFIFGIPFLLWQVLNLFYSYADQMKTNPGRIFSFRTWSNYSKLYCRHFNELDHQLENRLNKGYKPATKYMNSFISATMEAIAKLVLFICRALLAVIGVCALYSEHVLGVKHMLTIIAGLAFVEFACQGFIRNDIPQKYNQAELYGHVLQHIHYFPTKNMPSSLQTRAEFSLLFSYKIVSLLEELVSPIASPYVLYKHMRNKSVDIIDFFRNCSIEIPGIGDVCSFAMMNIEKNGNPVLKNEIRDSHIINPDEPSTSKNKTFNPEIFTQPSNLSTLKDFDENDHLINNENISSNDAKLELSLINFKSSNPTWTPFSSQADFIQKINSQISTYVDESTNLNKPNALNASLVPRTPHSSLINESVFMSKIESPEQTMTLSSIFLQNKLAKLAQSSQDTEQVPLLSETTPMVTYKSNTSNL